MEVTFSARSPQDIDPALQDLPQADVAIDAEVVRFIAHHALFGIRIGDIDTHLLAAEWISPGTLLRTRDKRFSIARARLELSADFIKIRFLKVRYLYYNVLVC